MIKTVIVLLLVMAIGLSQSGFNWLTVIREKDHQEEIRSRLKADIIELAKARFATAEYQRAVDYVSAQAQLLGLTAIPESVMVSQWERGAATCHLLLPEKLPKELDIVALTGSAAGDLEADEVVLVNYFFDADQGPPPHRFDEGKRKRIVFFNRTLGEDHTVKEYEKTVVQRNDGARWAAKYGAVGVLVRSVQTGDGPPHTGAVDYGSHPGIPAVVLSTRAADELERVLCPHQSSAGPDNAGMCDGEAKVHLKVEVRQPSPARQQANLIIRIPGTDPASKNVLVSAHLDSHDVTPGAADDAAGVAAVLAVMREFARNPPVRTILLVLFADEELCGSGARYFAQHHKDELLSTITAIEVDDGDGGPRAVQITSSESQRVDALRTLRQIVESVGAEANGLELHTDTATNGTDLKRLWEGYGIPEVAIKQDFINYFKKHHAPNDKPEDIDLDGLGKTTFLLIKLVRVLSSGSITPPHGQIQNSAVDESTRERCGT